MRSNTWFALLVAVSLAAVMTPMILLAAGGGGGGFDSVVHGIESRYHTHASRIPFMGLVSGIAGIATHGGVHGLHVAEIEHLEGPVDGAELNALVEERVGKGWQRMIRETSRDGDQQSLIYVKPDGSRMGLLVVDLDGHEMDVVEVSVDPAHLDDDMGEFRPHHHKRAHDSDTSATSGDEKQDGGDSDQATN
jgi:hypothetical protein